MIIENSLEKHGYAKLLIQDYHLEYPLQEPARVVWDPFELETVAEALQPGINFQNTVATAGRTIFGNDYDPQANLWLIQGNLEQLMRVYDAHAQALMGGPAGGDDDTFDYWPGAFEMLYDLGADLLRLGFNYPEHLIAKVERVIKSAEATHGPLEQWEAGDMMSAPQNLLEIAKEVSAA